MTGHFNSGSNVNTFLETHCWNIKMDIYVLTCDWKPTETTCFTWETLDRWPGDRQE